MTLYSPRVGQLLQGVSKQPEYLRAEGQLTEQINCISDIVQGLRRRPKFRLMESPVINGLDAIKDEDDYVAYMYERGDGIEAYIMIISAAGNWQTYDAFSGEALTSTAFTGSALTYITSGSGRMRDKLAFYTIADTTFVLNKEVEVAEDTDTTDDLLDYVLVWCRQSLYGKRYDIYQGGTTQAYVQNPATVAVASGYVDKQLTLDTSTLASSLASQLVTGGYTAVVLKNMVIIDTSTYGPLTWSATDGGNDEEVIMIKSQVDSVDDLPPFAPEDYKIKVRGLGNSDFDDFWVKWVPDGTGSDEYGTWQECAAPAISVGPDPATMPHKIVRTWSGSDPVFSCWQVEWTEREAGDENTNPMPSFVGNTVQDIFSYQNRLWFLSEENACATRAFDYFSWFAESVSQGADDDPIDSSSSDNEITQLKYGMTFNKDLVLLSSNAQFLHNGETSIAPSSFAVLSDSRFPTNPEVKPLVFGSSLIFPSVDDGKVTMWEMRKDPVSAHPDINSLSEHIGDYIDGSKRIFPAAASNIEMQAIESMAVHPSKGLMFVASGGFIYVLQMFYKNNERVQLAWHKWDIAQMDNCGSWYTSLEYTEHPTVSDVFVVGDKLVAIARFDSRFGTTEYYPKFIEMDLDLLTSTVETPELFLDFAYETDNVEASGPYLYDGEFYSNRVELPYWRNGGDDATDHLEQWFDRVVTSSSADTDEVPNGREIDDFAYDDTTNYLYFNIPSNWGTTTNFALALGCYFNSTFTPTRPYVNDQRGRAYTEDTQVSDVVVDIRDTVFFEAVVSNETGDGYTHTMNGELINDYRSNLGDPNHITGIEPITIENMRDLFSLVIQSESTYGFTFNGITWHVNMHTTGRRA